MRKFLILRTETFHLKKKKNSISETKQLYEKKNKTKQTTLNFPVHHVLFKEGTIQVHSGCNLDKNSRKKI